MWRTERGVRMHEIEIAERIAEWCSRYKTSKSVRISSYLKAGRHQYIAPAWKQDPLEDLLFRFDSVDWKGAGSPVQTLNPEG